MSCFLCNDLFTEDLTHRITHTNGNIYCMACIDIVDFAEMVYTKSVSLEPIKSIKPIAVGPAIATKITFSCPSCKKYAEGKKCVCGRWSPLFKKK